MGTEDPGLSKIRGAGGNTGGRPLHACDGEGTGLRVALDSR